VTSQVGWDDIEAELWKLGGQRIRPADIIRWRRLINAYAIGVVRDKYQVEQWLPEVKMRRSLAADTDFPEGLTLTCENCGLIGEAVQDFYRRPSYTTNHGFDRKCKGCINVARGDVAAPKGGYLCRGCKRRKPLKEFPAVKQRYPSKMVKCTACDEDAEVLAS